MSSVRFDLLPATAACAAVFSALVIGRAHAQLQAPDPLTRAQLNFKHVNASGSGKLNASEFRAFIDKNAADHLGSSVLIAGRKAYDRAFRAADADRDGYVSWSEFVRIQR